MKIYVASSWRNEHQPEVVQILRELGHEVYDFRNPPDGAGFGWEHVDPKYKHGDKVDAATFRRLVDTELGRAGYEADAGALQRCDACVYVLPCGKSASWEFGYASGMGRRCYVLWIGDHEPELMFREATVLDSFEALRTEFQLSPHDLFHREKHARSKSLNPMTVFEARDRLREIFPDCAKAKMCASCWNMYDSSDRLLVPTP